VQYLVQTLMMHTDTNKTAHMHRATAHAGWFSAWYELHFSHTCAERREALLKATNSAFCAPLIDAVGIVSK
jgi:hypothetical protein